MATPEAVTTDPADTHAGEPLERNRRKVRQGLVTGDKMDKTIVVTVTRFVRHPLYGRTVKQSSTFKAHDETNDAHTGDTVEITETRPTSKTKRWRLSQILERAK